MKAMASDAPEFPLPPALAALTTKASWITKKRQAPELHGKRWGQADASGFF
jgi:hypothetical protein